MSECERKGDLGRARALVDAAKRIVVLTGAGVSAESGVPTFRGPDGLWKSFRPEELATPEAFARDPRLVWEWYGWRRDLVTACAPNPAHLALARLALERPGSTTLVTQNVDGLHHRAARATAQERATPADPASAYPLEVHGAIHRDRCSQCRERDHAPGPVDASTLESLPRCAACGALMRPDVVWFGEPLDSGVLGESLEAARAADLCLVVGTSALVYPAASVPEVTQAAGGSIVEVNLAPTPVSRYAEISVFGPAATVTPRLIPPGPRRAPRVTGCPR